MEAMLEVLELILAENVDFKNENGVAVITCDHNSTKRNIYLELNILLNRFQVLGHSFQHDPTIFTSAEWVTVPANLGFSLGALVAGIYPAFLASPVKSPTRHQSFSDKICVEYDCMFWQGSFAKDQLGT